MLTTVDPYPVANHPGDIALASVCYIFAVCGTIANVLVIVVIISHRSMRKPSHMYVMCLATLDGIMSAFIMTFQGK